MIANLTDSPHIHLRPVSPVAVRLDDDFWAPRRRRNREVTLPSQYGHLEETGRLDNFRRAAGKRELPFRGYFYNDSDVYKWLEAAAWSLMGEDDPDLTRQLETVIDLIKKAQQPDGYLNTYFMFERAGERWSNLRDMHELYCAGHLIQAAIAHHRATGQERLLEAARRLAGHIVDVFGPGKRPGAPGHPEVEMALVELYRTTGDVRYLDQAESFLDNRGRGLIGGREYHIDHRPFRELERLAGHAVRALYLCSGAADLVAERGEPGLREQLERLWENMTERQMYITGGVGSRYEGEAFGRDWELPNERAYAETCAAIANVLWSWRMLQFDGDARYADVMELALYNGALAGISLDGTSYFYVNPLADPEGRHRRLSWYDCACCPTNIVRLLAGLPGLFYSTSHAPEGIWVHLYAQSRGEVLLPQGNRVGIRQVTRYPWEGEVHLDVDGEGEFSLFLRIPAWAGFDERFAASVLVNGESTGVPLPPGAYTEIRRVWQPGDRVDLILPMQAQRIESHPYVLENAGRVALRRGPLVYCCEGVDLPAVDLRDIRLPAGTLLSAQFQPELLGGITTLSFSSPAAIPSSGWDRRLYHPALTDRETPAATPGQFTAVPYYAWGNRGRGPMQVWLKSE
jgi:DUF1680 family protein